MQLFYQPMSLASNPTKWALAIPHIVEIGMTTKRNCDSIPNQLNILCTKWPLTSSHRMPYKRAHFCWDGDRWASIHAFRFLCFAGRLVNMPRVACHHGYWRVYTPSFLGVPGVTVGWPQTKGTASNERVHFFFEFLPNPFIQDLCLWRTSQEFVKTDLYPLSRGLWSLSRIPSVRLGAGR